MIKYDIVPANLFLPFLGEWLFGGRVQSPYISYPNRNVCELTIAYREDYSPDFISKNCFQKRDQLRQCLVVTEHPMDNSVVCFAGLITGLSRMAIPGGYFESQVNINCNTIPHYLASEYRLASMDNQYVSSGLVGKVKWAEQNNCKFMEEVLYKMLLEELCEKLGG